MLLRLLLLPRRLCLSLQERIAKGDEEHDGKRLFIQETTAAAETGDKRAQEAAAGGQGMRRLRKRERESERQAESAKRAKGEIERIYMFPSDSL